MFRPLRFWSQLTLGQKRVSQRSGFFLAILFKTLCLDQKRRPHWPASSVNRDLLARF